MTRPRAHSSPRLRIVALGLGEIHPVVLAIEQNMRPTERDLDPGIGVPAAGFKEQDTAAFVLGEAAGERAACATRLKDNDDVVIPIVLLLVIGHR